MTAKQANACLEQAAEWYATLRDGGASDADKAAWQQWLSASEAHLEAWRYVETISRRFDSLKNTHNPRNTADKLNEANVRLHQRRQILAGIAGVSFAAWLGWRHTALPGTLMAWRADYHTGTGEQQQITLPDGTRVWLNTASALNTHYSASLRRLELLAGEVYIDTAKDSHRSLVVDTAQGRLRALGTRFNVYQTDEDTRLAVYQGAVEIHPHAGAQTLVIPAGQQARFTRQGIAQPEAASPARQAWSQGVLLAEDITLRELVTELRRYHRGHIGLADDIAELHVYGSFPLRDSNQVLGMLTTALPVQINQTLPWWVSIERR